MHPTLKESFLTYTKIQWGVAFFIFCIEVIWIKCSSLSFLFFKKEVLFQACPVLVLFFLIYIFYKKFRYDFKIVLLLESTFFICVYAQLMLVLSYLAAAANQPLIDPILVSIDNYFGVYTPFVVFWFREHFWWSAFFACIYDSYIVQFPLIVICFGLRGEKTPLQRFLILFLIATPLTIIISGFFPAAGPYVSYHYTPDGLLANALDHLYELRDTHVVDMNKRNGIITFPSFHAVLALLYIYVARNERKNIFLFMLGLNTLVIFSCLPIGQHYFSDLIGAVPVVFTTILLEMLLFNSIYIVKRSQVI